MFAFFVFTNRFKSADWPYNSLSVPRTWNESLRVNKIKRRYGWVVSNTEETVARFIVAHYFAISTARKNKNGTGRLYFIYLDCDDLAV